MDQKQPPAKSAVACSSRGRKDKVESPARIANPVARRYLRCICLIRHAGDILLTPEGSRRIHPRGPPPSLQARKRAGAVLAMPMPRVGQWALLVCGLGAAVIPSE